MNYTERALAQLHNNIEAKQRKYRALKLELDRINKDLTTLGVKPDVDITPDQLPINATEIEQAHNALKDGGKNIKSFQKALGIFDQTELSRKRKALVAAGVTKETENYNNTNQTFVELIVETSAVAGE